jgi:hypothetical protein
MCLCDSKLARNTFKVRPLVRNFIKRFAVSAGFLSLLVSLITAPSLDARSVDAALETQQRLSRGEIVVGMKGTGDTKLVTGSVLIDESPDEVWQVVANPYEFCGKISSRMRNFQLMVNKHERSVMRVNMDVFLIPHFNYVVESNYKAAEHIEFHKAPGEAQSLKDFSGSWEIKPVDNGTKSELTYSMFMDPGFFVPQWLIREGVKNELPRTLSLIKKRVDAIKTKREKLESQTIVAASVKGTEAVAAKTVTNPL